MTISDLTTALEDLSEERLQALVDRLEASPDIDVTVGAWLPQCPMVLAGFDPYVAEPGEPELRFAGVWDRFAAAKPRWRLAPLSIAYTAKRRDVQLLLRTASAVLASRGAAVAQEPVPGPSARVLCDC